MATDMYRAIGDGISSAPSWRGQVDKTADYTILPGDNGFLFTNAGASGAVTFTLPTIAPGYSFGFFVVADQTVTIASAGSNDNIVTTNDAGADSIAFSTATEKIGAYVWLHTNSGGTKWYVAKMCANAMTIT